MARRKYNNRKTVVDGFTFDSGAEAKRYRELKLLQNGGLIKDLELQPSFMLQRSFRKNGVLHRQITYKADFRYYDIENNKVVIEDVKGVKTEVFKIKHKMFEKCYPELSLTIVK